MDKIICFGKNYPDHLTELGDKPVSKPVIFLKPPSVLRQCESWNQELTLRLTAEETHYETEFVIKLCQGGYQLSPQQAKTSIGWYTAGLDMTLRHVQRSLKDEGHPWTIAKVFPDAAIIGPWIETKKNAFEACQFSFMLDDEKKQHTDISAMILSPVDLVVYASQFFQLCAGDILFTGTPAGVGKVSRGSCGTVKIQDHAYFVKWI